MRRIICAVLASLSSLTFLPTHAGAATSPVARHRPTPSIHRHAHAVHVTSILARAAARANLTISQLRAEWQHVAVCEVGGNWSMRGPAYSGIGFANATWLEYGGQRFAPLAGAAPRDVQILIGMKITGGWVPDQNGCSPTGW